MPWTRAQARLFFSKYSPLKPKDQKKFEQEVHDNPGLIRDEPVNGLTVKRKKAK